MRAACTPQWSLFGEDVARGELGRAAEGQIFAHGIRRTGHRKPGLFQTARRIADPMRNSPQSALLGKIFGDSTYEGVELVVTGQFRLFLDRRVAILIGFRRVESIHEFGQYRIARRTGLNGLDGFSEGIRAHRPLPRDSCASARTVASPKRRR